MFGDGLRRDGLDARFSRVSVHFSAQNVRISSFLHAKRKNRCISTTETTALDGYLLEQLAPISFPTQRGSYTLPTLGVRRLNPTNNTAHGRVVNIRETCGLRLTQATFSKYLLDAENGFRLSGLQRERRRIIQPSQRAPLWQSHRLRHRPVRKLALLKLRIDAGARVARPRLVHLDYVAWHRIPSQNLVCAPQNTVLGVFTM